MSTDTDARVLATVAETSGTTPQIAAAIGRSKSPVAKALARLEKAGEVYRMPGGHDGQARQPDTWYHTQAASTETKNETGNETEDAAGSDEPSGRLARGELKALVLEYLEQNAGSEYGPSQLAKKLDRSAGAIANILDKAALDRIVELTHIRPKRYRHKNR